MHDAHHDALYGQMMSGLAEQHAAHALKPRDCIKSGILLPIQPPQNVVANLPKGFASHSRPDLRLTLPGIGKLSLQGQKPILATEHAPAASSLNSGENRQILHRLPTESIHLHLPLHSDIL